MTDSYDIASADHVAALTETERSLLADLVSHDRDLLEQVTGQTIEPATLERLRRALEREPQVGDRARLRRPIDRYPHFLADAGMAGTVTYADADTVCLRLDQHLPGAEDWDNEIVWSLRDGDDYRADTETI